MKAKVIDNMGLTFRLKKSDLGHELKVARTINGKSQREVAKEAGVSFAWLSTLETGRTTSVSRATAERLKAAAGWRPELSSFLRIWMAGKRVLVRTDYDTRLEEPEQVNATEGADEEGRRESL